jgi:DNA-binding response OmpR family regulator
MRVVAVFAANPALTAILAATLAAMPGLRVRSFDTRAELEAYMRLAPVDLLVCDFDCEAAPAGDLARALRRDSSPARRDLQIVALTRKVSPHVKAVAALHGIDEIVAKPMSPKYLLERVVARLKRTPRLVAQPAPRDIAILVPQDLLPHRPSRQGSVNRVRPNNVVSLFPGSSTLN